MTYGYALAAALFTGTGTVSVTAASMAVVGVGTLFLTELAVGDVLVVGSEERIVAAITDDLNLTVAADFDTTAAAQALTFVDWQYLDMELEIAAPKGLFIPYTQPLVLGSGLVRGGGWKVAEWRWGFLAQVYRDRLRYYCPGASASVYVRTRVNDNADTYRAFYGTLLWPVEEQRQAGRRLDFVLRFQALRQIDSGSLGGFDIGFDLGFGS